MAKNAALDNLFDDYEEGVPDFDGFDEDRSEAYEEWDDETGDEDALDDDEPDDDVGDDDDDEGYEPW